MNGRQKVIEMYSPEEINALCEMADTGRVLIGLHELWRRNDVILEQKKLEDDFGYEYFDFSQFKFWVLKNPYKKEKNVGFNTMKAAIEYIKGVAITDFETTNYRQYLKEFQENNLSYIVDLIESTARKIIIKCSDMEEIERTLCWTLWTFKNME